MDQSTALTTTQQKLAALAPKFEALDLAGRELRDLVLRDDGSPSHSIRQAAAMQTLRELLTPDVMAPIMALQGCKLGFKTDKDTSGGYSADVVRDVTIEALGRGGSMTRNRTNIIASGYYATKEQFAEWLDARQGRGQWLMIHSVPEIVRGLRMVKDRATGKYSQVEGIIGALVTTEVRWLENGEWRSEKLTHNIKGDDYAVADSYLGKAERKCGAWLYARITGEHVSTGDAEEVITVTGTATDATVPPKPESRLRKPRTEPATEEAKPVEAPAAPQDDGIMAALDLAGVDHGDVLAWLVAHGKLKAGQMLVDCTPAFRQWVRESPAALRESVEQWKAAKQ